MSAAIGCAYAEILDSDNATASAAWVGSEMCKRLGIPTPTCQTIVGIVKDFEAGKIPLPTFGCLDRFSLPRL